MVPNGPNLVLFHQRVSRPGEKDHASKGASVSDLPLHRLDPRMLRVWYVSDVIGIVVVAVLAVAAWAIVRHLGGDVALRRHAHRR